MDANPDCTSRQDKRFVHLESGYRGSSRGRQPDDSDAFSVPSKVVMPKLCARVEQLDSRARFRVNRVGAIRLIPVAQCAGKTQVVEVRLAAVRTGNDVVNVVTLRK